MGSGKGGRWRIAKPRRGAGVGTKNGWLELDLGNPKQFNSILIEEGWGRIQRFEIQVKDNDQWRTILCREGNRTILPSQRLCDNRSLRAAEHLESKGRADDLGV